MTLIARLSKLFQADLHDVLDCIEEPASLLRQSVRDMEQALAADDRRVEGWRQERAQIIARSGHLERSLEQLAEQLDTCFDAAEGELARALLRRRLEAQRLLSLLAEQRQALEGRIATAHSRALEQRGRLECLRQRAAAALSADDAPAGERWSGARLSVTEAEVEVAYLQEQQRRRTP